jgi:hypothetical protein
MSAPANAIWNTVRRVMHWTMVLNRSQNRMPRWSTPVREVNGDADDLVPTRIDDPSSHGRK